MKKNKTKTVRIFPIQLIGFGIFLIFFTIFFLHYRTFVYDRMDLLIFTSSLIFIIFIVSCYKIKIGLYSFIFFIPLLNSLTTILGIRGVDIILFLFFSLVMGFLVNIWKNPDDVQNLSNRRGIEYDRELYLPVLLFSIVVIISSVIIIYRYLNFLPFLSSKFNNISVNVNGVRAENSIYWTIKWFFNALIGVGLSFIIFNVFRKFEDIVKAAVIIVASNIIVFSVGFYQYYLNPTFGSFRFWAEAGRINATFTDPNSLGNYILIVFPIYIILVIYFKRWYQRLLSLVILMAFLAIALFSGSRNAFIGIILSSIFFIVLGLIRLIKLIIKRSRTSKAVKRTWISIASLILVIFILFIALASYIVVQKPELKDMYRLPRTGISLIDRTVDTIWMGYNVYRLAGFVEGFKSVSSERHFLWPQAMDMFTDYPVSGVGLGGFLIELPNYYEKNNPPVKIVDFTGNYYLQILSELGIAGLILVLAIFFLILKRSIIFLFNWRKDLNSSREAWFFRGFLIAFISTIIVLFFGPHTNFNEIQFTFWLVIGLLIVFINIKEKKETELFREPAQISGKTRLDLVRKVSLILVIVIFSTSLFVSSWTGLSINSRRLTFGFEKSFGFYDFETIDGAVFRWSGMDASEVIENNHDMIIVPVKNLDPGENRIPLFIRFFINNKFVKVVKIDDRQWHDITIDLSGFSGDKLVITLSCSRSWTPKQRGLSNDTRELGVMVGEFKFIK